MIPAGEFYEDQAFGDTRRSLLMGLSQLNP